MVEKSIFAQDKATYFIFALLIGVFAWVKYKSFPQVTWIAFGLGVVLVIVGFYFLQKHGQKQNVYVKEEGKEDRISTNDAIEYACDFMYINGFPIDFSKAINIDVREVNAREGADKKDTPVTYIHIEQENTRDKFDIFLKTESNETYKFLESQKETKNILYYYKGIKKLTCSFSKNVPLLGKEKEFFIDKMINRLASKSPQNYAYVLDETTGKFLGTKLVAEPEKVNKEEKEDGEE